jgi:adenine-specific DNA-methyltransferase
MYLASVEVSGSRAQDSAYRPTPRRGRSCRSEGDVGTWPYAKPVALPLPGLVVSGATTARVEYGEVFTKRWVADLILDVCDYQPELDLTQMRVIEPSVGSGAFLAPILDRLLAARAKHAGSVPWLGLRKCIRGWDLQAEHVEASKRLVVTQLVQAGCPPVDARSLADSWLFVGDFLLAGQEQGVDLVVGNPPYIRIEDIPAELLAIYRVACPTMVGRADIFVGFFEHGLDLLAPGGRLAFICADRWMRNAYGRKLRRKIISGPYSMDCLLTMHDAPAFDAEVSAYPAITVLRRDDQGAVVTGLANEKFGAEDAERFATWATSKQAKSLGLPSVTGARLPHWHTDDDSWPEGSPQTLEWLEKLAGQFPVLEDPATGTKIGIGVATGADAVYVCQQQDLPDVEADRLLPLIMAADVKSGTFQWTGHRLVNPWEPGGIIDLTARPRLAAYFNTHRAALRGRNVAKRSGDRWYRTIDRVNYQLLHRPMLVMEDMKAEAHPVLVPPGYYPHHNLYYMISQGWDLQVLGGLLLSKVIERQVAAYCVKMRGGTLRFQAQYLRRVRCPRPHAIDPEILEALAAAFRTRDRAAATRAALRAYKMTSLPT